MPRLLVSVRNVTEAQAAMNGGADLIDVKEPTRGPLGRADDEVIAAVIEAVAGRRPVSAAMGELAGRIFNPSDSDGLRIRPALGFVKWGLAGCGDTPDWRNHWRAARDQLPIESQAVAVAYADWQRADAPPPHTIADFAMTELAGAFLIDTAVKDGSTLLDWLPLPEIAELVRQCQSADVSVALAGSLGRCEIEKLLPLVPDWFAVRGAACDGGRTGRVSSDRVAELVLVCTSG